MASSAVHFLAYSSWEVWVEYGIVGVVGLPDGPAACLSQGMHGLARRHTRPAYSTVRTGVDLRGWLAGAIVLVQVVHACARASVPSHTQRSQFINSTRIDRV